MWHGSARKRLSGFALARSGGGAARKAGCSDINTVSCQERNNLTLPIVHQPAKRPYGKQVRVGGSELAGCLPTLLCNLITTGSSGLQVPHQWPRGCHPGENVRRRAFRRAVRQPIAPLPLPPVPPGGLDHRPTTMYNAGPLASQGYAAAGLQALGALAGTAFLGIQAGFRQPAGPPPTAPSSGWSSGLSMVWQVPYSLLGR